MAGRAEDEALMGVLFGEEGGSSGDPASPGASKAAGGSSDEVEPGWGGQGLHAGRVVAARDENTESTPPTMIMGGSAEARAAALAALRADLDLGPAPAPAARVGVSVRVKVRRGTQSDDEPAAAPANAPADAPEPPPAPVAVAASAPTKSAPAKAAPSKTASTRSGGAAWLVVLLGLAVAAAWAWVTLR